MIFTVFPRPRILEAREGVCPLSDSAADLLRDPRMGVVPAGFELVHEDRGDEGYSLRISTRGVRIGCRGERAFFNGLLTAARLFSLNGVLPCCRIEDEPLFPNRALMLDISRCRIYRIDYLKQMIRRFALLKYNQLQLYMEHTFAYKGHETVWKDATPYTPEEIREIDAYCRERGIELVPNQNSFGHMERWFRHPEYHHLAEAPEGFTDAWGVRRPESSVIWTSHPGSIDFVRGLYDQLLPCFESRLLNIGGDETYDLGLGRSREEAEKRGVKELFLDFLIRLRDEAAGRGYEVQVWADILLNYPELIPRIPEDMVVLNWGYQADHPFEKETGILAAAGRRFYVCTGTASWNSLAGRWENALENIRNGAYWAEKNGAEGYMVTDWGDNAHWQQPVCSWPGYLMAAQAAWCGASSMDALEDGEWTAGLAGLVFGGEKGSAEAALFIRKLASLYRENPVKLHNGSIFSYLLCDPHYPYMRKHYEDCAEAGCGRADGILDESAALLDGLEPGFPFRGELEATLEICRCGVLLARHVFAAGGDCSALSEEGKAEVRASLEDLAPRFEGGWKECCRPGGLEESLGKLMSWKSRL